MAMIPADVLKLPEEIIFEILLRLPIKSLCRFRCVSKPWLALITSPTFVKTHFHRTKIQRLILASMESLYSIKLAKPIGNQLSALGVDFPPLKENPRSVSKYKFVGSCNGLLCIMLKPRAFVIFNPSTREMKRIPDIGAPTFAAKTIITVYGFGYCEQIDDFKFVKIVDQSIVWIYSLKTNSWKEGEPFHFKSLYKNRGVYLNGAIHWILKRENTGDVIVVFDLAEERFREFSLPDGVIHYELSIGVLGGHLRVTCPYDFDSNEQLWVMDEYGVKESWRRVFIQRESSDPLEPLWFWKEDEMLLARGGDHLIQCNVKDGSWQDLPVADVPAIFDAYIYEESLVSPNETHN